MNMKNMLLTWDCAEQLVQARAHVSPLGCRANVEVCRETKSSKDAKANLTAGEEEALVDAVGPGQSQRRQHLPPRCHQSQPPRGTALRYTHVIAQASLHTVREQSAMVVAPRSLISEA